MDGERRYEVLEALGRGGFGTVYRARYQGEGGFSQQVALKVLNSEVAEVEEIASRLRDEARVLGLIRHRAIVQVHRLARLDGKWTVVMEYVRGADLGELVKAGHRVPMGPALEIVAEVAAALHVAYDSLGHDGRPLCLLHRDIKPSNIQITPLGEVKVLDFGIARADFEGREALTRHVAFGSAEYMAPERLDFIDGAPGDVYGLGAVLFELLTGSPFGRTSSAHHRHQARVHQALDHLWEVLGHEHFDMVKLIETMLDWDPEQRPSAREVERRALALRREVADQPLRFWAEEVVPTVIAARVAPQGRSLTGSVMIERAGQGTSAEAIGSPPVDEDEPTSPPETPAPVSSWTRATPPPAPPASPPRAEAPAPVAPVAPPLAASEVPRVQSGLEGVQAAVPRFPTGLSEEPLDLTPEEPRPGRTRHLPLVITLLLVGAALTAGALAVFVHGGGGEPGTGPSPAASPAPPLEGLADEPVAPSQAEPPAPAEEPPPPPPEEPTRTATTPIRPAPAAPTPAASTRPEPTPAAPTPAASSPAPTISVGLDSADPAPPPPPTEGKVSVKGHPGPVSLVSGDKTWTVTTSRALPPGTYAVHADFGSGSPAVVGTVTVEAGQTVRLKCDERGWTCDPM